MTLPQIPGVVWPERPAWLDSDDGEMAVHIANMSFAQIAGCEAPPRARSEVLFQYTLDLEAAIPRAINAAIVAEREACAQVSDDYGCGVRDRNGEAVNRTTTTEFDAKYGQYESLSEVIRARGKGQA